MHPRQRGALPQQLQTGLPQSILRQSGHVGGSLGFGGQPEFESVWDKLEAEADALVPSAVPRGPSPNLRQELTNFLFQAAVTSDLIVPYNPDRIYLMLENIGAANVFVAFGKPATVTDSFRMVAGGFYEPIFGCVTSVHGISAAGLQNVIVIEGFRVN